MKTYDIEVQRLKSIKHDKGQFALAIDALVLARPQWLGARPLGGVNLAITYGLGLIVAALVLAVVYMAACRFVDRRTGG